MTKPTSSQPDRQQTPPGRVLVIIVNFNGGEPVLQCIQSVLDQSYPDVRVVVVDNDSRDGSVAQIRERFPNVQLIENGYNAGWGVACNIGIAAQPSEFIALLNNDAFMDRACLAEMVSAIRGDARYGACASRILLWDDHQTAEVCGVVIHPDGSSVGRGRLAPADAYMQAEEVFCANDCCCLYRREMIEEVGDYDPDFFIYCDETELGWRHQVAGWRCIYQPTAVAYHAHSRSAGSYSAFKAYHVERNRLYICFKYFSTERLIAATCHSLYRYAYQWYLSAFARRGALAYYRQSNSLLSGLGILIKAHWHALRKWAVMRRRRCDLVKRRFNLSDRHICGLLRRFSITTRQLASYE